MKSSNIDSVAEDRLDFHNDYRYMESGSGLYPGMYHTISSRAVRNLDMSVGRANRRGSKETHRASTGAAVSKCFPFQLDSVYGAFLNLDGVTGDIHPFFHFFNW